MRNLKQTVAGALILVALLAGGCSPRQPEPPPTSVPQPQPGTQAPATALPQPTETVAATATATQVPADPATGLEGLDIDTFFEASYRSLLLRNPETVTELGLAQVYGTGNDRLTDISAEYVRETQALERRILELLQGYDRASLSPEQQLTAEVYEWYLEDRVRGQAFAEHDYPITHMIYSVHNSLLQFFTDIHPVTNLQDAQDYVTRLSQVDTKFEQLLDGLQRREAAGVILPRFLIGWVLGDVQNMARSSARSTPYYSAFAEKLQALDGVSAADRDALLQAAEDEIEASVIPAYQSLATYLAELRAVAPGEGEEVGVSRLPDGEAYYAYLLHHYTTTDLSADEIHALGQQELVRIHAEMRVVFDQLGYPQDEGLIELYDRVARDGGMVSDSAILSTYESLIEEAGQATAPLFDLRPQADVIVVGVPIGGYYLPPAVDGSRPGTFYASTTGTVPRFTMSTLAYHEAVPGHHFQMAIAQQLDLPALRRGMDFTGYIEGWALYAERLTWEVGLYTDDPYGDLGRLQAEAFRAARLVIDTGLHTRGWTYDQAVAFLAENTGIAQRNVEFEAARYIVLPGQATAYAVGFLKMLELRQAAQEVLGDEFDLRAYHNVVLGNGAVPLETLEQIVERYLESARTPASMACSTSASESARPTHR